MMSKPFEVGPRHIGSDISEHQASWQKTISASTMGKTSSPPLGKWCAERIRRRMQWPQQ